MSEAILIDITIVILLGIGAQWLAWRFRLPSILLLLVAGFLAGPVFGALNPQALQGDWLFAFVSVSIGIILFEGGLSLRLSELAEVGTAVRNLITLGVLITWAIGTLGAYYLVGFNLQLSVLTGAILTVTGPTVVVPLLRHVRPKGRIGAVAKWEGITIDPVGAILAVLVFETILLLNDPSHAVAGFGEAAEEVARGLALEVVVALGVGVIATALLLLILRRRLVPDFLRNPVTLMIVVTAFALSNILQEESGLLTTTLMGIALANQSFTPVQRIIEFKENLQVLLIGSLFILLSARLEMTALSYIDGTALAFLALMIVVARPLAVAVSSLGTTLTWAEQAFLAWMAPRGIVAAAVASLFAFRLEQVYPGEVGGIVPLVFLIIVGTVAVYGLTAGPLANWLNLAEPNPQGILFIGADRWVCRLAKLVQDLGFSVLLVDSNPDNIERANRMGLPARRANALSESILDDLDMSGIGRVMIMIPNDEVSSLTALHFSEVFETQDIYQLAAQPDSRFGTENEMPKHLRGRPLFGEHTSYVTFVEHFDRGDTPKVFTLTPGFSFEDLEALYESQIIPMFILRQNGDLSVISESDQMSIRAGDRVIALVDPEQQLDPDHMHHGEGLAVDINEVTADVDELKKELQTERTGSNGHAAAEDGAEDDADVPDEVTETVTETATETATEAAGEDASDADADEADDPAGDEAGDKDEPPVSGDGAAKPAKKA